MNIDINKWGNKRNDWIRSGTKAHSTHRHTCIASSLPVAPALQTLLFGLNKQNVHKQSCELENVLHYRGKALYQVTVLVCHYIVITFVSIEVSTSAKKACISALLYDGVLPD